MLVYLARRLLAVVPIMAGVSFLVFLMLHLVPKDDPQALDMLQVMQANVKQVGMELEIRPMALAASEDLARKGENGLTFMDWRGTDPDILTLHYHSKNIGGWNMGWFKDPAMDKLLDDAREEMNRAKR